MISRLFIFFALLCAAAVADVVITPRYVAIDSITLSSAAEAFTIQTAGTKHIVLKGANVYCSVACTVQVERDGTAATTTAGTVKPVGTDMPSAVATVYTSSNVGSGTVLSPVYNIAAGQTVYIDLTGFEMQKVGATRNYTFRTNSITGTVNMLIVWEEQ